MATATEMEKVSRNNVKVTKAKPTDKSSVYPQVYGEYVQRIENKAYELYEKRGREDGHDLDDWFQAQKTVESEMIAGK